MVTRPAKFDFFSALKLFFVLQTIFGILMIGFFWSKHEAQVRNDAFQSSVKEHVRKVKSILNDISKQLTIAKALYDASEAVEIDEFAKFLKSESDDIVPILNSEHTDIGWVPSTSNRLDPPVIATNADNTYFSDQSARLKIFADAYASENTRLHANTPGASTNTAAAGDPTPFLRYTPTTDIISIIQPVPRVDGQKESADLRGFLYFDIHADQLFSGLTKAYPAAVEAHILMPGLDTAFDIAHSTFAAEPYLSSRGEILSTSSSLPFANGKIDISYKIMIPYRYKMDRDIMLTTLVFIVATILGFGLVFKAEDMSRQLETERDRSREASKAKANFLATMSHEIRTPIHGIVGMSGLIQSEPLSERQAQFLRELNWSADALLGLVNSILDFSKIEAGGVTISEDITNIKQLGQHLSRFAQGQALAKGIGFEYIRDDNLPDLIKCDAHRIRQIITNLISNAVKFTSKGQVTLAIRRRTGEDDEGRLEIAVADTGIGMNEVALSRVFDRFTQADGSTTRRFGGTGLGLAIVKELVELLGGTITVTSAPEIGSTFVVSLPLVEADPSADIAIVASQNLAAHAYQTAAPSLALNILVAEDDRVNQLYIGEVLRAQGHKTTFAGNGHEAVEAIKKSHFDLVLMDCQMPVCDGYSATKQIRAYIEEERVDDIPIVALTANAVSGECEFCLANGFDDFVTKPFTQERLASVIRRWSNGRAQGRVFANATSILETTLASTPAPSDIQWLDVKDTAASNPRQGPPQQTAAASTPAPARQPSSAASRSLPTPETSPTSADDAKSREMPMTAPDKATETGEPTSPPDTTAVAAAEIDMRKIEELRQTMGANFSMMVDIFKEDIADYSEKLSSAFEVEQFAELRRIAHSLKSSSRLFGAHTLSQHAADLEAACKALSPDDDTNLIVLKIDRVKQSISRTSSDLDQRLAS